MDKIWDRKSFEVGGHWPLWMGMENRQKSNAKKHTQNWTHVNDKRKITKI